MTVWVDDEDLDRLMIHKWHVKIGKGGREYAARTVNKGNGKRGTQYMHTFITGWNYVDHKNGDGLDNRRSNLRESTHLQNKQNVKKYKGKYSSQYKGVFWVEKNQKWRGMIRVNGKAISLGMFIDEIEAAKAYDKAAQEYFGEFAVVNISN